MDKKLIYGAAGLICIAAVFPFPYGFYTFVRLVVSIASIFAAIELKNEENFIWVLFGGVALLFNPIVPVHLDRGLWFPIDLIVGGSFGWMVFRNA